VIGPLGARPTVVASHGKEVKPMHAAIYKAFPIFSILTAMALATAFAPVGVTMPGTLCPPFC
jgi:hypothetical protein